MYFPIFQPEDRFNLCLNFNESQHIYAYERKACLKKSLKHLS